MLNCKYCNSVLLFNFALKYSVETKPPLEGFIREIRSEVLWNDKNFISQFGGTLILFRPQFISRIWPKCLFGISDLLQIGRKHQHCSVAFQLNFHYHRHLTVWGTCTNTNTNTNDKYSPGSSVDMKQIQTQIPTCQSGGYVHTWSGWRWKAGDEGSFKVSWSVWIAVALVIISIFVRLNSSSKSIQSLYFCILVIYVFLYFRFFVFLYFRFPDCLNSWQ